LAIEFWNQGSTVICVDIDEDSNQFTARTINTRVSTSALEFPVELIIIQLFSEFFVAVEPKDLSRLNPVIT
jgi:hypothetical protein